MRSTECLLVQLKFVCTFQINFVTRHTLIWKGAKFAVFS